MVTVVLNECFNEGNTRVVWLLLYMHLSPININTDLSFTVTDQCNNNNGGCSQLCLLTPFGRKCSCSDGLVLDIDGITCQGVLY